MMEPSVGELFAVERDAGLPAAARYHNWAHGYAKILAARIRDRHLNIKDLSSRAGMTRQTLSRKLQNHDFTYEELKRLLEVLGIDGHCAMLAVEHEGDWQLYDSNTLELAASLAKLLPGEIAAALSRDIQPLKPAAIRQLAREVAQRIAKHDNDVLERLEYL
jgi:transcriptional regulator with XRE-family HTH domain